MRIRFLIIILLVAACSVVGQETKPKNDPTYDERPIHFGFSFGLNTMGFVFSRNPINGKGLVPEINTPSPGFQINAVSDLRLFKYLSIRILPGCSFGDREVNYWYHKNGADSLINTAKTSSSFAEMPILLKYKSSRLNNYAPYFIAGINPRFDFDAKKHDGDLIQLKRFDIYAEMGFGIDFYNPFFKFSSELKLSLGMFDILNHTPIDRNEDYTRAIDALHSKIVMFTIYFE